MSGHSKWANIRHTKGKNDAQKAKAFTKIGREIAVAVKAGGPDPTINSKLKDIITKARTVNMPNDNVQRCIKKAAGDNDTSNYEEIIYEGYGPCGVAVIVQTLTDNRNRTVGELRHYFDKCGGNMGQSGCVSFMFDTKGVIIIGSDDVDEETLMMEALDGGAEDFSTEGEYFEILTSVENFSNVCNALENKYTFVSAEIEKIPQTQTELTDPEDIKKMNRLLDMLDDNEDVQNVYHNWANQE